MMGKLGLLPGADYVSLSQQAGWVLERVFWNIAAMSKLAWVVAQKNDNLWDRWVNGVYVG